MAIAIARLSYGRKRDGEERKRVYHCYASIVRDLVPGGM